MSVDLIDYLIEYCVGRDHRSIRYIETVAMAWKEEGITTVEMAKIPPPATAKEYFSVLKAMGIANRNPSDAEISLINTWTRDYGFAMELIQKPAHGQFCRLDSQVFHMQTKFCSAGRIKNPHFRGCPPSGCPAPEAQAGKSSVEEADKPKSAAPNRFNNFHQRDYDFAEYEKKLLNKPN